MNSLLWTISFVAGIGALAFVRAPAKVWVPAVTIAVAVATQLAPWSAITKGILWIVLLAVLVPVVLPGFRRSFLSAPLLAWFRKVLPTMSRTEQEALEAGSVWWDGDLFSGRPDWNRLLSYPAAELSTEEQAFLDGPTNQLCEMLDDWKITQEHKDLPPEVWEFIKTNGFFGMIIPRQYGGLEYSARAHSQVVMKLASRSVTAAVSVMVPNSLGPAKLLLHYGTEEQKNHFLPRLAKGEDIPCFALTGPEAGSDAARMPDTGVVCRGMWEGKEVVGLRLNWEKRYITLGPVATVLGLAFKLHDPDHLLGEVESPGITVALIPTDTPGVEIGERHNPLNVPFQNGPNRGRDVFVPIDWIIGGPERAGQGWRMLMECLADGRAISLPALSTGASKVASRFTGAYARVRQQFNLPIGRFEGVEEALARIAGKTYQMDAARLMILGALDHGEAPSVLSAVVKYHLTEGYRTVMNDAMDVQGGSGICLGPRNLIASGYQSIPVAITVEGANILTRSMIIFGQGATRCHPFVLQEMQAAANPDPQESLQAFDRAFWGHIGFTISNVVRSFVLGLTRGRLAKAPVSGPDRRYYQQLGWMSAAFAMAADISMLTLGGSLKRKERLSARLGDVLSNLYLGSATLKRFHEQGRNPEDAPLMHWAMRDALHQIQTAMVDLLQNFPNRPLAWLMRLLIFPTGKPFAPPSDRTGHEVAGILLAPSPARDRLTEGVFIPTQSDQKAAYLDLALEQMVAAEPVERKVRAAMKQGKIAVTDMPAAIQAARLADIITEQEADLFSHADALHTEVIQVDAFAGGRISGEPVDHSDEAEAAPPAEAAG